MMKMKTKWFDSDPESALQALEDWANAKTETDRQLLNTYQKLYELKGQDSNGIVFREDRLFISVIYLEIPKGVSQLMAGIGPNGFPPPGSR